MNGGNDEEEGEEEEEEDIIKRGCAAEEVRLALCAMGSLRDVMCCALCLCHALESGSFF
jgi:hypothetical protein